LRVPIVGRIRAGQPVMAEEHVEGHVVIDGSWVGASATEASGQHFALKVHGDSMITAGILDGDYVIIRQQPTAEHGDIVVALIGEDATVKRLAKIGDRIQLQPAHPTMEPIIVPPEQPLTILGKVVAVFRKVS